MDFQRWLREAAGELSESESPKRDAEILLEHVTGKARTYLLAFGETELTAEQEAQLAALLARRKTGEPVAHLVGEREFWSLPLYVSAATLIPRLNELTSELSANSQQINRVLRMLENAPQSLIFGAPRASPGPGEPGFTPASGGKGQP